MTREQIELKIQKMINSSKEQYKIKIRNWSIKMRETEEFWGFGGPYYRQEAAQKKCMEELDQLEELSNQLKTLVRIRQLPLFIFYCRNCNNVFASYLYPAGDWHECPNCKRMVYEPNPERLYLKIKEEEGTLRFEDFFTDQKDEKQERF